MPFKLHFAGRPMMTFSGIWNLSPLPSSTKNNKKNVVKVDSDPHLKENELGLPVGFLSLWNSVLFLVEYLSLLYLPFIS